MSYGPCGDNTNPGDPGIGCEEMGCGCLRYENGKLQTLNCGVWVDVPGQSGGTSTPTTPTQPGGGTTPTPPGGTNTYCGAIGRGEFLLPMLLSSGDTIHFNDLQGAWHDTTGLHPWNCADGYAFVAGVCIFQVPIGGTDPLPSKLHMQLVLEIEGVFYDPLQLDFDANPTVFTVPGGISNKQAKLRANTADLNSIDGQVSFCFQYTNGKVFSWQADRDFTQNPGAWQPYSGAGADNVGQWNIDDGFVTTQNQRIGLAYVEAGCMLLLGAAYHLTSIDFVYSLTPGTNNSGSNVGAWIDLDSNLDPFIRWDALEPGDNQHFHADVDIDVVTKLGVYIGASNVTGSSYDGGSCSIKSIRVTGTGPQLVI
jgi:hypothetical protein